MVLLLRVATVKDYIHFGTLQQFKLEFWFTIISTLSFLVLLLVWRWYGLQRTGPHLGAIVLIALLYSMAFVLQLGLTHHDAKCWTEWVMGPDNTSGITWELNSELAHQVHPYIGRINQDLGAMVAAVPIIAILVFAGMSLPMPMSVPTIWLITITQIAVRAYMRHTILCDISSFMQVYITGPYDIGYFLVVPVTIGIGVGASVLAIVYDHQVLFWTVTLPDPCIILGSANSTGHAVWPSCSHCMKGMLQSWQHWLKLQTCSGRKLNLWRKKF